jgi:hypothetical protein
MITFYFHAHVCYTLRLELCAIVCWRDACIKSYSDVKTNQVFQNVPNGIIQNTWYNYTTFEVYISW